MNLKLLLNGGSTTSSRAAVEALYLIGAAALTAGLSAVTQNPDMFSPTVVLVARLLLGVAANLLNPKVPNN